MTYEEYMMESVCSALDELVGGGTLTEEQADEVFDLACEKYISEARRLDKEIIKKADKIEKLQNEIQKNPDMTDEEKRNLLDKIDNKEILPAYKAFDYGGKPFRLTVSRFKKLQDEMKQNPKSSIKIIDDGKVNNIHHAKTNLITKDHKIHDLTPAKEKEPGKYLKELKKRNLVKAVDNL